MGFSASIGSLAVIACVGDDPTIVAPAEKDAGTDASSNQDDRATPPLADASVTADAADAAVRKCQTVTPPPAPNDFFCADFDGTQLSEGWTGTPRADAGTLSLSTLTSTSTPSALRARAPFGTTFLSRGSSLDWQKLGATTIRDVDVTFDFNPVQVVGVLTPSTGDIGLVAIEVGGSGGSTITHALRSTRGKKVLSDGGAHVGLFLQSSLTGGAATQVTEALTIVPVPGVWTNIQIVASSTGQVVIRFNGIAVFNKTIFPFSESRVQLSLGAVAIGATPVDEVFQFDSFVAQVNRN